MGKRLFVAVDVDEPTRAEIGRISSDLRQRIDPRVKVSWVRPDRMHLTLHFFGQADDSVEGHIRAALANPILQPPFEVSFEGLGFFPESRAPRVLWLGMRHGVPELRRIQQMLQKRLAVSTDAAFKPHLTLGRFRARVGRAQIGEIASIPASAGPCRIDRVTVYESRLSPAGPTYVRLAEAFLTP